MGIEMFLGKHLPICQASVIATSDDNEGRSHAVSLLKRLMVEIVNWLTFEEAGSVAEELFSEC